MEPVGAGRVVEARLPFKHQIVAEVEAYTLVLSRVVVRREQLVGLFGRKRTPEVEALS